MTKKEILRKTKERIADKSRWVQGKLVVNAMGNDCPVGSPEAARWCAIGSLTRETTYGGHGDFHRDCYDILCKAAVEAGYDGVLHANDYSDHETVMAIFDRAIELAGEGR